GQRLVRSVARQQETAALRQFSSLRSGSFTSFVPSRRIQLSKSGHSANAHVYEYTPPWLAPGSSFFPQQRLQRAAQQLTESPGDSLPVAGLAVLESAKALHQIKRRAVDLNGKNARPAIEPLAPASGIGSAPLPKGGRFLNHRAIRSGAFLRVTSATASFLAQRGCPLCVQFGIDGKKMSIHFICAARRVRSSQAERLGGDEARKLVGCSNEVSTGGLRTSCTRGGSYERR